MENLIGPPSTRVVDKLKNISFAFVLIFIWIELIGLLLYFLTGWQPNNMIHNMPQYLFFTCFMAPLWEELCFRYAPITFAKKLGKDYILPAVVLSSIVFGWGHGSGTISLLVQGVMGFVFATVYIKNGYSLWSSILLHSLWNTHLIFVK